MTTVFETICVIGLGYVGLPTAAVFANRGTNVIGVDVDEATVAVINRGEIHIVEPDLDIMVRSAVGANKLRATTTAEAADAFIIAVPTPFRENHKPDLAHVEAATRNIAAVLKAGDLIVIESTSPVGTTEQMCRWLADLRPDLTFPHTHGDDAAVNVAHSPERVLPGRVLLELVTNDRVIGGISPRCAERTAELYRIAVKGECHLTNAATAELVKLAENAYRDVNIAFANELSLVADRLDINVWDAIALANRHPRVNILNPGPGVGGHCIAVDPWFIVDSAPDETRLIQAARAVNDAKPGHVAEAAIKAAETASNPVVACFGLAYKANIDDLRESPAIAIVADLAGRLKENLLVVEPHVEILPPPLSDIKGIVLTTVEDAIERAGIIVLLTDHREFLDIDRARLSGKLIIDTRGAWRRSNM